jgi:hypothetical protein
MTPMSSERNGARVRVSEPRPRHDEGSLAGQGGAISAANTGSSSAPILTEAKKLVLSTAKQ